MTIAVAALYQFRSFEMTETFRKDLYNACQIQSVMGTLLLADEGINGTISGDKASVEAVIVFLKESGFDQLELKYSYANNEPFLRLKVLWKKEVVTLVAKVFPPKLLKNLRSISGLVN